MINNNNPQLFNPNNDYNIRFSQGKTYKLIRLIQLSAPNLLTPNFMRKHMDDGQVHLFEIEIEDSFKKWTIIKRFEDFLQLKKDLPQQYSKQMHKLPFENLSDLPQKSISNMPYFFCVLLTDLVKKDSTILQEKVFAKFICNIVPPGKKQMKVYYQAMLHKKAGGRHNQSKIKKVFQFFTGQRSNYFTITGEGIHLTESQNSHDILDNLVFTSTFSFIYGQVAGHSYGITFNSSHRILQASFYNIFDMVIFVHFLGKAIADNQNLKDNRFHSFARVQNNCEAKYYIDGQDYFADVFDALLMAQKQVFITGWMISPYLLLKRPDIQEQSRLDKILQRVAKSGVKINIIIYNAPKLALNIDSEYTQNYLNSLNKNIRVLTHPHYVLIPFLWSHHQKMIVIDQKIGFMGGLDLGYGRMDSKQHFLTDQSSQFWPGADYCNYRITDILKPKQFKTSSIDRNSQPRMPWHDIGVRLMGASVSDLARHFIQYWNYANAQLSMDNRDLLMYVGLGQKDLQNINKQAKIAQYESSVSHNRHALRTVKSLQVNFGIDFLDLPNLDFNQKYVQNYQKPAESQVWRQKSSPIHLHKEQESNNQMEMEFYACHIEESTQIQNNAKLLKKVASPRQAIVFQQIILSDSSAWQHTIEKKQRQNHQILRSVSKWSHGLQQHDTEHSIQNAYVQLIQKAEEFIYIENQFFISVDNLVTIQLCKRIMKAHQFKQRFRVIIILPALPGFEGHPADENGAAVFRVQIYLHLENIKKLLKGLKEIPNLNQYLYFFSLRTHSILNQQPVTEIIYVHSKLMIVDDRVALIGSANINDRSLMGNRDTQLAVVIEQTELTQIKIEGKSRMVSRFAHELRKELYMQHFDIQQSQAIDYLNDDVWDCMIQWSQKNHKIYRDLFGCYPDNEMASFQDMNKIQQKADPSRYEIFKTIIKGQAIPFQFDFLKYQNLALNPTQKEYFLPKINFN